MHWYDTLCPQLNASMASPKAIHVGLYASLQLKDFFLGELSAVAVSESEDRAFTGGSCSSNAPDAETSCKLLMASSWEFDSLSLLSLSCGTFRWLGVDRNEVISLCFSFCTRGLGSPTDQLRSRTVS